MKHWKKNLDPPNSGGATRGGGGVGGVTPSPIIVKYSKSDLSGSQEIYEWIVKLLPYYTLVCKISISWVEAVR